ncbi:FtsX-like permease family protein [Acutalibacter sp. 1XD8-33]|uniref:FtsX-like permease family protein n=1 Tax=Acutalibacter sp. 1XD8-33 TaxID=2320081 RepID=UPI000EA07573|nr:FtsX-like permease family protein [Acutalibacter sp. 1XD8-33]RKJ41447.1 FtsX-like permease family protein [Acutalibacter sp. 1XD8-33]
MNRSYRKNILRTVRGTLSRFLAIFAIVALGSGFLAGVLASPLDMRVSADRYYDSARMFDLRVVSTLGLTSADMEKIAEVSGVEAVMPAYDMDLVMLSEEGDAYTTRLHSLPEAGSPQLNTPVLQEGRLPEAPGECAVILSKSFTGETDWIGQTLTVDPEEKIDALPKTFTVVGTVQSSLYLSLEQERSTAGTGTLGLKLCTVPESFDQNYYTTAYLTLSGGADLNAFYQEYEDLTGSAAELLEVLGEDRAGVRYREIVDEANEELADARKEYEDAKAQAEEELADAKKKLLDGEAEIAENEDKLADAKQELEDGREELEEGRAEYRTETASAQKQIDDGWAQVNGYQSQIDSGREQIAAAQGQITAGRREWEAGSAQLAESKIQLDQTQAQLDGIDQGKAALAGVAQQMGLPAPGSDQEALGLIIQLEQLAPEAAAQFAPLKQGLEALAAQGTDSAGARQALEVGLAQYQQGLDQLQKSKAQLDQSQAQLNAQLGELEGQQSTLNAQKSQLTSSQETLRSTMADTEARLAQAEKDLASGQAEYDDGAKQLEDAKQALADGWQDYREGEAEAEEELSEAEEKLLDAQREIDDIQEGEWYVFSREDNPGFSSYASNADKIAAIAQVFPVFFFLVAALVALTTMARMVEEERQQIGTMKALGYTPVQIAGKYLFYAAAASLLGCVAGVLIGMWLFPTVIINAYNIMYDLPEIVTPFSWSLALFSAVTATLCTLAATLNACWSALREVPARLMLPKAPKAGKRILLESISPLWRRMKFTQKVTARNLFRYKKRFFMTVTGIAGCTALLVTGFGIRDSVSDIVGIQYSQLSSYQLIVGLKHESALEGSALKEILGDESRIAGYLPALQESGAVVPKGDDPADDITIFVPSETDRLPEFFHFRHRTGSEPVEYGEDAVIVTEKLAERQHLSVGDVITVKNQDEIRGEFTVTDICENYVYHYLYISAGAYEEAFGKPPENNSILCQFPPDGPAGGEDQLTTELLKCTDVAMTNSTVELSESFHNSIQSINYIVVVLIVSAGALAFVVVYNLTNINITERMKELATIKVLGFYNGEVAAYVYRETAALTVIGTGVGLLLGVVLHQFVIRTAEVDMIMFGRAIYAPSYIWAALLTVVFSVLVNLVMYRKLTAISMVESMKAPE